MLLGAVRAGLGRGFLIPGGSPEDELDALVDCALGDYLDDLEQPLAEGTLPVIVTRPPDYVQELRGRDRSPDEDALVYTPEHSLVIPRTPSRRPDAHTSRRGVWRTAEGSTLPEGQMGITATVRQAKLRPECAERYPTLPARMWTSATCLAELVASYRGARPERPGKLDKERTLSEADFDFRGGLPRWSRGLFARTRIDEPAF
jgi:hypothetical protein